MAESGSESGSGSGSDPGSGSGSGSGSELGLGSGAAPATSETDLPPDDAPDTPRPNSSSDVRDTSHDIRDALVAFGLASAGVAVLAAVGRAVPFVDRNLGALVAVVFLYLPVFYAWRRGEDLVTYGFRAAPARRGLWLGFGIPLLIFPLFAVAFVLFYDSVCHPGQAAWMRSLAPPGTCASWDGWGGMHAPGFDGDLIELAFVQVVVIALPEELFFRGFIHHMLERAVPPRRQILGGGVGWALVLSSALFAMGHLAAGLDFRRLSVFFPGLMFGWMRSATGSILAGTIAHASSNLFIRILERMFF